MSKNHLITAGLAGCILLVSCEPIPVEPVSRYGPPGRDYRQDNSLQQPDQRYADPDGRYGPRNDLPPAPQPTRDQYPTAERTDDPNRVLSPYAPYNVIDVEGFRTGQLAKDPSNGKIFRIP